MILLTRSRVRRGRVFIVLVPPAAGLTLLWFRCSWANLEPPVRETQSNLLGGASGGGAGDGLALRALGEREAALEGALRIVRAEGGEGPTQGGTARVELGARGAAGGPVEHQGEDALAVAALGEAPLARCADLANRLVERKALAAQGARRASGQADQMPGARADGALPGTARATAQRLSPRRASRQSSGTTASAAWVGVEQATAATSSSRVESRSWPMALTTGTRMSATVRQSVSSQNAQRSARLPPPRATRITSTSGRAASAWIAAVIAGAARRS